MPEISETNRRFSDCMTMKKITTTGSSKTGGLELSAAPPTGYLRWLKNCSGPVLLLIFFCGCRTTNLFTASGPGWRVQQGQALWRPERGLPEFGGDLVLAEDNNGRALIQFDKTPLSMVFAETTSNRWLIRFPQRQMNFSGRAPAPTRFAWLYLSAALAGKPVPSPLHFERKPDGGWRLENSKTGETLDGFLSP